MLSLGRQLQKLNYRTPGSVQELLAGMGGRETLLYIGTSVQNILVYHIQSCWGSLEINTHVLATAPSGLFV